MAGALAEVLSEVLVEVLAEVLAEVPAEVLVPAELLAELQAELPAELLTEVDGNVLLEYSIPTCPLFRHSAYTRSDPHQCIYYTLRWMGPKTQSWDRIYHCLPTNHRIGYRFRSLS